MTRLRALALGIAGTALGCAQLDEADPFTADEDTGTAGDSSGDGDGDGDGDGEPDGPNFDVGPDRSGRDCPCGSKLDFSYIWVANSVEATVSKINTQSLAEEGRYRTHEDWQASPSRTSVSLSGRRVAVANRYGGVAAITTESESCDPETNGIPGLQTSSGKDEVLDWGEDDCVDWFAPFEVTSQRPIAWAAGKLDPETCEYYDEKVWTSGCNKFADEWVWVHRIDGGTGVVEDSFQVEGFACYGYGGYGGAVDGAGNFWMSDHNVPGTLARIDADTLETEVWETPTTPYGITVDHAGRPWITCGGVEACSAARFDPQTETWAFADDHVITGQSGIQEDAQGRMWTNYWSYDGEPGYGVVAIDANSLSVGAPIEVGTGAKGISIDLDGYVWSIAPQADSAIRIDPQTQALDVYDGLRHPYTYSDMTGWGLQNAACEPAG
jgi:streptogramin lyase